MRELCEGLDFGSPTAIHNSVVSKMPTGNAILPRPRRESCLNRVWKQECDACGNRKGRSIIIHIICCNFCFVVLGRDFHYHLYVDLLRGIFIIIYSSAVKFGIFINYSTAM